MINKRRILVVAAHADDEILGCGGTMAKHADAGDEVSVLFMTDGVGARSKGGAGAVDAGQRSVASERALEIVGAKVLCQMALPDNAMDALPRIDLIRSIEPIISAYQPDVIYTHHGGDLNIDHRRVLEAVLTVCRPQPGMVTNSTYSFEVASSTAWAGSSIANHFTPQYWVDISLQAERKIQALQAYHEEMRTFPHARSIEALEHQMRWRGSQVGVEAAEAFVVERQIWT
jgi:LmbE family N-acetylglucosaminyl deacetylase